MLLGAVLLAPPVAADPEQCQADCASKTSEVIAECVLKCPQPSDAANTRAYQSCALRCSENQQGRFNTCARKCDSAQDGPSGKKKGQR
jgi:hypothetical protein